MKPIIIVLMLCPLMLCCRTSEPQQSNAYEYEKAEVYYAKMPQWFELGYSINWEYFSEKQARDLFFSRFTISDRDSIRYIENRLRKGEMTFSPAYNYWSPRIIVLLHSHDRVDTLITNTYTGEPLQFNSYVMEDTTLSLYVTECVGKHDLLWANALGKYFFNGDMQIFLIDALIYEFHPLYFISMDYFLDCKNIISQNAIK